MLPVEENLDEQQTQGLGSNQNKNLRKKGKSKRQSIEEMGQQIDTLRSTLLAMKDLIMLNNQTKNAQSDGHDKQTDKDITEKGTTNVETSTSQTTIYKNALQKDKETVEVDQEVTFRVDPEIVNRYSTSSDEHIDTSDELMLINLLQIAAMKLKEGREIIQRRNQIRNQVLKAEQMRLLDKQRSQRPGS